MTRNKLLLITIKDAKLNALLYTLKSIFYDNKIPSLVHITIRGPHSYTKATTNAKIKKFMDKNPVINIRGCGMFTNTDSYVVYLKVNCKELTNIWYKPDYQNEFNPHITIYKGANKEKAHEIFKFLEEKSINYDLIDYEIEPYSLDQLSVLRDKYNISIEDIDTSHYSIIEDAKKNLSKFINNRITPLQTNTLHNHQVMTRT